MSASARLDIYHVYPFTSVVLPVNSHVARHCIKQTVVKRKYQVFLGPNFQYPPTNLIQELPTFAIEAAK